MRAAQSFTVSLVWLVSLPCGVFADVSFRPLDTPRVALVNEDINDALDHSGWTAGLEFLGWGQNSFTLYYQGDAENFQDFLNSLRRSVCQQDIVRGIASSAVESRHNIVPLEDPLLILASGRGKHIVSPAGLEKEFDYDWSVNITYTYSDLPRSPTVATVSDPMGRQVQRRIVRQTDLAPRISISIVWYVGEATDLETIELPIEWLFAQTPREYPKVSIYYSSPRPDEINTETLLASERIERYLARKRREKEQAEAAWRLSEFYGITIDLDAERMESPTIIANYRGAETRFDVKTGERRSEGESFPETATSLVQRWLERQRDAVLVQWQRANNNEPIEMVDPLE